MASLTYRTAGESHGKARWMPAWLRGCPGACSIDQAFIDGELRAARAATKRGGRQKIETDHVEFLTGVRLNRTIASPVTMLIPNKDSRLDDLTKTPPLHRPRPGHADLAGSIKWLTTDCRETLERASAQGRSPPEWPPGRLARCLLRQFNIEVFGFVRTVGEATAAVDVTPDNWRDLLAAREESDVYCPDSAASQQMRDFINQQKMAHDTAGGVVEAHVFGCPIGLGSCMTWDGRLDSRIAAAVVGIQAFKGVEIGLGFETARRPGSKVHATEIFFGSGQQEYARPGFSARQQQRGRPGRWHDQRHARCQSAAR